MKTVPTNRLNQRMAENFRESLRPDVHTISQIRGTIEEVFDGDKIHRLAKEGSLPEDLLRVVTGEIDKIYARVRIGMALSVILPFEAPPSVIYQNYGNAITLVGHSAMIKYRNQDVTTGAVVPLGNRKVLGKLSDKLSIFNLMGTA